MLYSYSLCQQEHYNNMDIDLDFFKIQLELYLKCPYCYIVHDKETDKHIHVLIIGSPLLKTDLLTIFPFADINILDNVIFPYEYLIHKNNPDKYQYDKLDIVYYCCSEEYILNYNYFYELEKNAKKNKPGRLNDYEVLNQIANDIYYNDVLNFRELLSKYGGICVKFYRTIMDMLESKRIFFIE